MGTSSSCSWTSFVNVGFARLQRYADLFRDAQMEHGRVWLLNLAPLKLTFKYLPGPPVESMTLRLVVSTKLMTFPNIHGITVKMALEHMADATEAHGAVFSEDQAKQLLHWVRIAHESKELLRRVQLSQQAMQRVAAPVAAVTAVQLRAQPVNTNDPMIEEGS